jgi:methylated-DNA-[protein]-cysteine S-methyltransferase
MFQLFKQILSIRVMSENGELSSRPDPIFVRSMKRMRSKTVEKTMNYYYKNMPSVIGKLKLIATDNGLAAVLWENDPPSRVRLSPLTEDKNHPILLQAERQLAEYLDGKRETFSIALDPAGTPFQNRVWDALKTIPFGETRSYGDIARQIGNPKAVRAVGAANGKNPISVIVPCHRVIGASGSLTGFAGGLKTKERLLNLEAKGQGKGQTQLKLSA